MKNMKDSLSCIGSLYFMVNYDNFYKKKKGPEIDKTVRVWPLKNSQSREKTGDDFKGPPIIVQWRFWAKHEKKNAFTFWTILATFSKIKKQK
jgi:hypothetical protein